MTVAYAITRADGSEEHFTKSEKDCTIQLSLLDDYDNLNKLSTYDWNVHILQPGKFQKLVVFSSSGDSLYEDTSAPSVFFTGLEPNLESKDGTSHVALTELVVTGNETLDGVRSVELKGNYRTK